MRQPITVPSVIANDVKEANFRSDVWSVLAMAHLLCVGNQFHFVLVRNVQCFAIFL